AQFARELAPIALCGAVHALEQFSREAYVELNLAFSTAHWACPFLVSHFGRSVRCRLGRRRSPGPAVASGARPGVSLDHCAVPSNRRANGRAGYERAVTSVPSPRLLRPTVYARSQPYATPRR